jgi:hypothetical protein
MKTDTNTGPGKKANVNEEKSTVFKRIRARICHNCPVCNHARKNPDSKIGRMLHHRYHADNCPFWKAEKEVYGEDNVKTSSEMNSLMMWKAF